MWGGWVVGGCVGACVRAYTVPGSHGALLAYFLRGFVTRAAAFVSVVRAFGVLPVLMFCSSLAVVDMVAQGLFCHALGAVALRSASVFQHS